MSCFSGPINISLRDEVKRSSFPPAIKQHLARPALESQRRLQASAVTCKSVSHFSNFRPAETLDAAQPALCLCPPHSQNWRLDGLAAFLLKCGDFVMSVSIFVCLFFYSPGELQCVDPGFAACSVKTGERCWSPCESVNICFLSALLKCNNRDFFPPYCFMSSVVKLWLEGQIWPTGSVIFVLRKQYRITAEAVHQCYAAQYKRQYDKSKDVAASIRTG